MATIVSIQQGGTGANNASDAVNALGTIANTGGIFTGEVKFTGQNNSINVANSAVISGNANISGNLRVTNQGFFGNGLAAHITSKDIEANTIRVAGFANTNGASEIMVINKSNGSLAYAEFIALNDKANQEQGWISVGINSSEYNDPDFTLTGPDDGYLLFEPPLNSNANGDLIIGTGSNGLNNHIVLAAGGFAPTDAQMIISPADLKTAEITNSVLTSNVATLTTANTHTFIANDQVVIASVGAPYDGTFTISAVTSNTFSYAVTNNNISPSAESGTATQYLPFNKGTVQLTAQLFVGENSKSTIETADITLAEGHAIPLGIVVDNDGPGQTVMFNKSNGTLAYSEFIAHNDAGNVEMGWISMGINSSGYDDPEYPITKADDAYILYEPPANTSGDGDLIIGTGTNGTKNRIILAAEGFDEANAQVIITPNESVRIAINTDSTSANTGALQVEGGIGVQGSVFVQGNQTIQGDLIVNGTQTIQSIDSVAASGPLSILGDGNSANTWDFGVVGTYAISKSSSIQAITNKSLANNSATLTTANNHSFSVEDIATITGVDATFNGVHRITAVTSNTFSYFKLANNISSTAATGNVSVGLTTKYTGIVKDTANATWKLLSNIEARPDFNVNLANTSLDNLRVATINANSFVTAIGINVGEQANNAYAAANNKVSKSGDTITGDLYVNTTNGGVWARNGGGSASSNTVEFNIRPNSGKSGYITFTESEVDDRWGIGIDAGGSALLIKAGLFNGTERFRITNGGNVGIGSTNPGVALDVTGVIRSSSKFSINGNGAAPTASALEIGTNGVGSRLVYNVPIAGEHNFSANGVNRLYINATSTGGLTSGGSVAWSLSTNTANALTLTNEGRIGIGTTNPSAVLQVIGNAVIGQSSNTSTSAKLDITAGGNKYDSIIDLGYWDTFDAAIWFLKRHGADGTFRISNLSSGIENPVLVIDPNSNIVGIGITNPASLLHLRSSNPVIQFTDSDTSASAFIDWQSGTSFKVHAGADPLVLIAGNAEHARISAAGNVGIGTTNPSVKLHVSGASIIANNTSIDPDNFANQVIAGAINDTSWAVTSGIGGNAGTGDSWAIGHNGSNLFFAIGDGSAANTLATFMYVAGNRNMLLVPEAGNIGIATTTPSEKLHVQGNQIISGSLRVGTTVNHPSARLFAAGEISTDWSSTISLRYNVSGQTTNYFKGMTGTSIETALARGLHIFNYDADANEGIAFYPSSYAGQIASPAMKITPGGNVGIGSGSVASKLDVYAGDIYIRASVGVNTRDNRLLKIYRGSLGADQAGVVFGTGPSTDNWFIGHPYSGGGVFNALVISEKPMINDGAGVLQKIPVMFFTTGAGTAAGNVGIGTTNPGTLLDVGGTIRASGRADFNGQFLQGNGSTRSTSGSTFVQTFNEAFAANVDIGDGKRFISIVNESTTSGAYSQLGFRVNPAGGTNNAMLDLKFQHVGSSNQSKLHFSFLHNSSWFDRLTISSEGILNVGAVEVGRVHTDIMKMWRSADMQGYKNSYPDGGGISYTWDNGLVLVDSSIGSHNWDIGKIRLPAGTYQLVLVYRPSPTQHGWNVYGTASNGHAVRLISDAGYGSFSTHLTVSAPQINKDLGYSITYVSGTYTVTSENTFRINMGTDPYGAGGYKYYIEAAYLVRLN